MHLSHYFANSCGQTSQDRLAMGPGPNALLSTISSAGTLQGELPTVLYFQNAAVKGKDGDEKKAELINLKSSGVEPRSSLVRVAVILLLIAICACVCDEGLIRRVAVAFGVGDLVAGASSLELHSRQAPMSGLFCA